MSALRKLFLKAIRRFPALASRRRRAVPVLLQTEASECGLVCLAMVAGYWGDATDLITLRQRFSVSRKGTSLKNLIDIAQRLNLLSRPLRVELQQLSQLKLPCILHWDMNHFVVLEKVTDKELTVHDPAAGKQTVSWARSSEHFTGIVLELTPGAMFKAVQAQQRVTLRSLMGKVDGLYIGLARILLTGIVLQAVALAAPFYLQWVVDDVLAAGDRPLLTVLGCGFLLLVVLQAAVGLLRSRMTAALSADLSFQWMGNAFSHLLRLPIPWFEKRHLGDITSRFHAIQIIQKSLTTQLIEGVIDGLLVFSTLLVMFFYSATLTSISLCAVALYATLRCLVFQAQRQATAMHIAHSAKQSTLLMESARGIQSIRLFGREQVRRYAWSNALVDQLNAELRIARLTISFQSANSLLFNGERIVVVWLAALAVMDNRFSTGMLFAFLSYKDQFSQRIAGLLDKIFELRMLHLHGERVADILLAAPEEEGQACEVDLSHRDASIQVCNVSFRYGESEPYVLRNLSLHIQAGQCVAITGVSGCGKTTLLKLMLGLLTPCEGEILIGGVDLQRLGLSNYRRMTGTVMQDDHLFTGTLSDNICFFDTQPDQEKVTSSARQAAVHEEIMAMPMNYNTLVGDIGSGLSAGQRQRILLARALYRAPSLLILDEATSHLDTWNEKLVNAAIAHEDMTRLLVAHRPETIAMAQRVITLEQGQIVSDVVQREAVSTALHVAVTLPEASGSS